MNMILAIAAALALQDPAYDTLPIEAGPRADRIEARDLNGDGRPDLVVQNGRDLQVFLQKGKSFDPKPSATLRLDPAVFLWTFGALDGAKLPAVFTQGSRGVQTIPFNGASFGPPEDRIVHPSIFEGTCTDGNAPLFLDFAPDLDRDGRSDVLLYQDDRLYVMKQHPGGQFRCIQKLAVPADAAVSIPWAHHQRLSEVLSVPVLSFGDSNGDGRPDVSCYYDEQMGTFAQRPDGTFTPPSSVAFSEDVKKRRGPRFFQFDVPPRVADFNGDGLIDVALIYPSKGRVQIYYGRADRTDFSQPDELMKVADGWSTGVYLEDLNGDGKLDLIMGVVRKFGISEGIQVFLSGKLDLELHLYAMQEGGRFTKDPVQELKFSIPFSFQVTRDSASLDLVFRPTFQGDFNKDGLRDMLIRVDEKTLQIYPGARDRLIADEPSGAIALAPPEGVATTEPFVADLNGDGISDLLLKHVLPGPRHVLELKLSR